MTKLEGREAAITEESKPVMKRLAGKNAIVTGATRGIGKAIALCFAEEGANVFVLGTNEERGNEVVELLKLEASEASQAFFFKKVDVSNHAESANVVKEILEKWVDVDILVNCAGITRDRLFISLSEEDWDSVMDTNLKSVYNMTHPLLRKMIKRRSGKIINISSVVGIMGNPGQSNYAASKLGMIGFTKSLAKEVAKKGVTVNCIAPGYIASDMTDAMTEEAKARVLESVPMGRMGEAKEIAKAALFLASDEANYITGQVITVDGGMTA